MAEVYTAPLANPSPGGLYSVAAPVDITGTSRLAGDYVVETWNCGASWVLPIKCDDDFPDPSPMGAEPRNDWLDNTFTGDIVGADDNCSALVSEPEAGQRAQQLLRLQESVSVEKQLVPKLLAFAGTPTDVTGLVAAVGALEESIAEFGFTGVIHAAPHLAAALQNAQLIVRSGQYLLSPSGHRWAFGAGYAGLGETLVATGPVVVLRGEPVLTHGPDYPHNQRLTTQQRDVLVAWECWTEAVTIGA